VNKEPDDFKIARGFWSSDWKKLDIHKNTKWNESWEIAVAVFERRINARFIYQINALIKNKDKATASSSGFAIVALDCLLIETLNQFYEGIDETPKYNHAPAFHAVFQRSSTLKDIFNTKDKTKEFYYQIRCGLLHQAQTKGNSKINRKIKTVIEWCNPKKPADGLTVHSLGFHKCVEEVYSEYLDKLRIEQNEELRDKFRTKMNLIAGMS
jgi:hypothetical protein